MSEAYADSSPCIFGRRLLGLLRRLLGLCLGGIELLVRLLLILLRVLCLPLLSCQVELLVGGRRRRGLLIAATSRKRGECQGDHHDEQGGMPHMISFRLGVSLPRLAR